MAEMKGKGEGLAQGESTGRKLLAAATEVFEEQGYEKAGLREIARRAGANVAAVSYHFGSKEELYRAVLIETYSSIPEDRPMPRLSDGAEPEETLRAFIRWHVGRVLGPKSSTFSQLFLREMRDPTPAFGEFVELSMRPIFEALIEIVAAILDLSPHRMEARQAAVSVVSQYVIYKHTEAIKPQFLPELTFDDEGVERTSAMIAELSIGGLRHYRAVLDGQR